MNNSVDPVISIPQGYSGGCPCPIVEWRDDDAPLTLPDSLPAVIARFQEYGSPEYALAR